MNGLVQEMSMLKIAIGRLLTVRFDLAFGLPAVNADVAQLRQVIMNLIVNASDAIGDAAGTITLATRQVDATRAWLDEFIEGDRLDEGPYVAIEVTDTGIGMSPDTARRIFEPFFTTKFTGRGLGLSAVLGIVRGHGGAIRVRSAEGMGTTFLVLLPGSVDAPQAERSAPPQKLPSGAGRLVLVVDDDDGVRYLTKRILETLGFEVLQAEDGEHGLALFQANAGRAALALVDLTMPRMGGGAVAAAARTRRHAPGDPDERLLGDGRAGPHEFVAQHLVCAEAIRGGRADSCRGDGGRRAARHLGGGPPPSARCKIPRTGQYLPVPGRKVRQLCQNSWLAGIARSAPAVPRPLSANAAAPATSESLRIAKRGRGIRAAKAKKDALSLASARTIGVVPTVALMTRSFRSRFQSKATAWPSATIPTTHDFSPHEVVSVPVSDLRLVPFSNA
ncbi:MAG: response regulator [Gemmatimonadetes bacterium]|nr:response regulator [Gemmatimonadota bacterium]